MAAEGESSITDLAGTRWILDSLDGEALLPGTSITLDIGPEQFSGSAGCNAYAAEYLAGIANRFRIGLLESNLVDCQEPEGVLEQEMRYLDLLRAAVQFSSQEDELILLDLEGRQLLAFRRRPEFAVTPDEIIGKTWRLISAPGLEEVLLSSFTLWFEEDSFQGTTVCRDYAGKYQADRDALQITFLEMTTEDDCSGPELQAEGHYTTMLGNTEQYNLASGRLELFPRRGEKLIYKEVLP